VEHFTGRVGTASAPIHHGEIVQGAFTVNGRIQRGLVTLPCRLYHSLAVFASEPGRYVRVRPAWRRKARQAAELAVREAESAIGGSIGGCLEVHSDVPLSRGFGSSTSDVLAAIRAVDDAFGLELSPSTVARLAVQAESASDSLMYDQTAVLFAHRDGALIEDFGVGLPPVHVLGFGTGKPVDTLTFQPARYTAREIERFDELRVMLRHALATQDTAMMGEVATASTWLNQKHLPMPYLDRLFAVAAEIGAAGVSTAHSGNIGGLLFAPDEADLERRVATAQKLLRGIGYRDQWRFDACDKPLPGILRPADDPAAGLDR
jgi:uncharacterized protein involved in propanediol utilization